MFLDESSYNRLHQRVSSIVLTACVNYKKPMEFIVDLQGFKRPENNFILKELAIISVNDSSEQPTTFLFQPPCPWSDLPIRYMCMNAWLQRNCHGIPWNSGDVPYEKVGEILRNNLQHADIIYVKGLEKIKWLKNFIGESYNIVNLDDFDYPPLRKYRTKSSCPHHRSVSEFNCAMENVKLLKSWLRFEPFV